MKPTKKELSAALRVGGSPCPDNDAEFWLENGAEKTGNTITCGNSIFDSATQRWDEEVKRR